MKKTLTIIGLAAVASLSWGYGQTIISFQESGVAGNLAGEYPIDFINDSITGITLTADSNLDVATLSVGSGATAGTAAGSLGFGSSPSATLGAAITANNYHSILLTPSTGFELNISGITFNADASNATSTFTFYLLSSVTGFTSSDSLGSISIVNSAAASSTINLSSIVGLQGVDSSVEFRIYFTRSAGAGTAAYYADDDVNGGLFSVNGTVTAVPEPTAAVMVALGLTGVTVFRRRRAVS